MPRSSNPELQRLGRQLADTGEVVLPLHEIACRQPAQCACPGPFTPASAVYHLSCSWVEEHRMMSIINMPGPTL